MVRAFVIVLLASIVLPTYNRRARLGSVLDALARQTVAPDAFEVVVVNDGSADDTAAFLDAYRAKFRLRPIHQANSGPATARNTGIMAAEGKYVVFLDDDVVPVETFLAAHLRAHQSDDMLVVLGPLSSLPYYRQPWVAWEQAKLELQYQAMLRGDWQPTFRQFWTGNASVLREHLLAVGGFDVGFLRGEDIELGYRLHLRGLGFVFNSAAQGFHHAERSLASWVHAHDSYGRLEVRIFERKGDEHLVMMLGDNWRRLHPLTRSVVSHCIHDPVRFAAATQSMQSVLKLEDKLGRSVVGQRVCSVLANLIYWKASAKEMGIARAARVFGS